MISGLVGAAASAIAAAGASRIENKRAAPSINAISHIAWGGPPPASSGEAGENLAMGIALHTGASVFWATFFEQFFGRAARRSTLNALAGGAAVSTAAFITDYYIVSRRFRPGFEAYLSKPSLFGVYAALAAGFALAAQLTRGRQNIDD